MSFSAMLTARKNKCAICGEPFTGEDGGGVAMIGMPVLVGEEARQYAEDEDYDGMVTELVLGMDWLEDWVCHNKCLADAVVDATAEKIKEQQGIKDHEHLDQIVNNAVERMKKDYGESQT